MAWSTPLGHQLATANAKSAATSIAATSTANSGSVGQFVFVIIAVDNTSTGDGDNGEVTSVTDSVGNTYVKLKEQTNGQGAAAAGCTVSLWASVLEIAAPTGTTWTANFSSRTARTITVFAMNMEGSTFEIKASTQDAVDAGDPSSLDLTVENEEHLWIRAIAMEGPGESMTKTSNYSGNTLDSTSGGSAPSNVFGAYEIDIFTGTSNPSDPSFATARDEASVLVAIKEHIWPTPYMSSKGGWL